MSTLTDTQRLENEIADLIHEQVYTFRRAHHAPTRNEADTAYAEFQKNDERLKELLEDCNDIDALRNAILGATVIL